MSLTHRADVRQIVFEILNEVLTVARRRPHASPETVHDYVKRELALVSPPVREPR